MNLHIRCLHHIIYIKKKILKNRPTDPPHFCHERANKQFFFGLDVQCLEFTLSISETNTDYPEFPRICPKFLKFKCHECSSQCRQLLESHTEIKTKLKVFLNKLAFVPPYSCEQEVKSIEPT